MSRIIREIETDAELCPFKDSNDRHPSGLTRICDREHCILWRKFEIELSEIDGKPTVYGGRCSLAYDDETEKKRAELLATLQTINMKLDDVISSIQLLG